jgi:hypothetical protein
MACAKQRTVVAFYPRIPVLTMLWNIGEDISKLSGVSFEGDQMVFGHVAAGLVAKKADPKMSLGALLVAAEALDTL